jgi:four helix bundle suffix protein
MVQAARSGVQNIAEGSVASATSKKTELKLTNVARASLEELRLDYEDFLRHRQLRLWESDHPALKRFRAKRCRNLDEVRAWVANERQTSRTNTDGNGPTTSNQLNAADANVSVGPCLSPSSAEIAANGVLSLLNICQYLLRQQMATLERSFVEEGGFTERLYRFRSAKRNEESMRRSSQTLKRK